MLKHKFCVVNNRITLLTQACNDRIKIVPCDDFGGCLIFDVSILNHRMEQHEDHT